MGHALARGKLQCKMGQMVSSHVQLAAFTALEKEIRKRVNFNETEMNLFLSGCTLLEVPKGTVLLEQGRVCKTIYYIFSGLIRHFTVSEDGKDTSLHFGMENAYVTEYTSFLSGAPSVYTIQCMEPCVLIGMPRETIHNGYETIREGNKLGRLMAEDIFMALSNNLNERQTKSPTQRYAELHLRFPGIYQRVPQHMIASYLGITPVHLSRIRKEQSAAS